MLPPVMRPSPLAGPPLPDQVSLWVTDVIVMSSGSTQLVLLNAAHVPVLSRGQGVGEVNRATAVGGSHQKSTPRPAGCPLAR